MTASLETKDLTIRFGGHVAVDGVSCAFRPGELTAIVGPNGAGKTTYFNLISGQLRASSGAVILDGGDVTGLSAAQRANRGIGRAFQLTNLFPGLSVAENIRLAVQAAEGVHYEMMRPWRARGDLIARADEILEEVALTGRRHAAAAALSHGDQRKLEVALMIALKPAIFMFDEPTAGMSVDEVPVVLDLIARLKQDASKTILLVEHKMDVVRSLADRIIVLHNGRLMATASRPRSSPRRSCRKRILASPGRGRHERAADFERRAYAYRPLSHFAGRRSRRAGRQDDDAARPQRRRQDDDFAYDHGPVARLGGYGDLCRPSPRAACDAGHRPRRHLLCAGNDGRVFGPDGEGKLHSRGARRPAGRCAPAMDFRLLSRLEEILAVPRRLAIGRPETDAVDRARHCRAAPAFTDRRADQRPRAGDCRRSDRVPARDQARRRRHSAG